MEYKSIEASVGRVLTGIGSSGLRAPKHIFVGAGGLHQLEEQLPQKGTVWLLCGRSVSRREISAVLRNSVRERGLFLMESEPLTGEPDTETVDRLAGQVRDLPPDLLIGVGGGSVLDTAKAVAALGTNGGPVSDYLEGLGVEKTLAQPPLPWLAVPTVAGTGAEATKNAVVRSIPRQVKRSMRDDRMLAQAIWLFPEATLSVPPAPTAAGGLDTLTQLLESCLSAKRHTAATNIAHEGLGFMRQALPTAYKHPQDIEARAALLWASLLSGISLANSGLAMAHGIAAALGGRFGMAHGMACGLLLPHTMRYNRDAAEPELTSALAAFLGKTAHKNIVEQGLEDIEQLVARLGIPPDLRFLKLTRTQVRELAEASGGSSMSGNPVPMNPDRTFDFLAPLCGV